jgi:hypothetical protein
MALGSFRTRRASAIAALLVVLVGVAVAGCGAADEAQKVEQAVHDDLVAVYNEAKDTFSSAETAIEEEAKDDYAAAKAEFEKLEPRILAAKDAVGDEAVREYREMQHVVHDLTHDANTVLHGTENAGESAWHGIVEGWNSVHQEFDHVIDSLQ